MNYNNPKQKLNRQRKIWHLPNGVTQSSAQLFDFDLANGKRPLWQAKKNYPARRFFIDTLWSPLS